MAKSYAARCVFRCFKLFERAGDRLTGAAGPFFIAMAVGLIGVGVACWFDTIQPTLPFLTYPLNILVVLNLFMHYYYACTISPGFVGETPSPEVDTWNFRMSMVQRSWLGRRLDRWAWATRRRPEAGTQNMNGLIGIEGDVEQRERRILGVKVVPAKLTKCTKCLKMRPERAHHCRAMATLSSASLTLISSGSINASALITKGILSCSCSTSQSAHSYSPSLAGSMFGTPWQATIVMAGHHLYQVMKAETSVEGEEFGYLRKECKKRGRTFTNAFHVGRSKNLQLFFNIGPGAYSSLTLVLPLLVPPYTNGYAWARVHGLERHHGGIGEGEEVFVSDEEEEEDENQRHDVESGRGGGSSAQPQDMI